MKVSQIMRRGDIKYLYFLAGILTLFMAILTPFLFVNVPILDDWTLVGMVDSVLSGQIPWAELWSFHGEQRLPITRLILSVWAAVTSWNMHGVPWLNLILIFLSCLCLTSFKRRFWKDPTFWIATIFMFSLPAIKTINWCINLNTYLSAALAVYAVTYASENPDSPRNSFISALLAALATFSFGNGLMVWPALLPLLWVRRKESRSLTIIWTAASMLCLSFYFSDFMDIRYHPSLRSVLDNPAQSIKFFLIYLGAIFHPFNAVFFGGIGLATALTFIVRSLSRRKDPTANDIKLACVLLFVLGNALLTTLSRSHFGPAYAVADRYQALSCYFWAGIVLCLYRFQDKPGRSVFVRPLLLVLVLSQVLIMPLHWWNLKDNRDVMLDAVSILKQEPPDPHSLGTLFEIPGVVERNLPILKARKLSIFQEQSKNPR